MVAVQGVVNTPLTMPLEKLVVEAVRARTQPGATLNSGFSDREVIDAYVERIVVRPNAIDIESREEPRAPAIAGNRRSWRRRPRDVIHPRHRHHLALERTHVP